MAEPTGLEGQAGLDEQAELDGPTAPESTETKGERTRRRLLALAIDRFGERGYRTTSVSEIARAAGLTQAAVYAYFDSKESLFDAAVDTDVESLLGEVRDLLEEVEPPSTIPSFLMFTLGALEGHPLVSRVLEGEEREALPRLLNLTALHDFTAWLAGRLERGQAAGTVRSDIDARVVADGAETLILGLLMAVVQVGGTHEHRRQLGVVALFDAALRAPS